MDASEPASRLAITDAAPHELGPGWNSDLLLAAAVADSDTSLTVEWAGYALFGQLQASWRDIRIEFWDGTVLYRRITASSDNGATETLTIDSAPGVAGRALSADMVLRISSCSSA